MWHQTQASLDAEVAPFQNQRPFTFGTGQVQDRFGILADGSRGFIFRSHVLFQKRSLGNGGLGIRFRRFLGGKRDPGGHTSVGTTVTENERERPRAGSDETIENPRSSGSEESTTPSSSTVFPAALKRRGLFVPLPQSKGIQEVTLRRVGGFSVAGVQSDVVVGFHVERQ